MQTFQKIVLISAIVILIIVLIFIGFALQTSRVSAWPPTLGDCPDYWVDMSGNGSKCTNTQNLGNGTCRPTENSKYLEMDFTQPSYKGGNGACAKYQWATGCGVQWDGITYGAPNPCTTTSSTLTGSASAYNPSSNTPSN